MLSKFVDIVNRSILEYFSDIQIDITEAELATLPGITQQACEQFATQCIAARAQLARFAKVETQEGRNRQVVSKSEEDRNKLGLELARSVMAKRLLDLGRSLILSNSQRLKSVLLQSVHETSDSGISSSSSQHGRKRSFADVEPISKAAEAYSAQEKRQKATPGSVKSDDGLSRLRTALAQARTLLKAA